MIKTILQRDFQGQDSWGAYLQQVTIDTETKALNYRLTEGGNCCYGDWEGWQGEQRALEFVFGDLPLSESLINEFKEVCLKARDLSNEECNMDNY